MLSALATIADLGLNAWSAFSAKSGQKAANEAEMAFNAAEAAKSRDWAERMASTAYQRTRKDLEAAGYNPLLAFPQPAHVPAGAVASAKLENENLEFSRAIRTAPTSALDAAYKVATIQRARAEARQAGAQAYIAESDADAFRDMPLLRRVHAIFSSVPGLGGILGGAGIGSALSALSRKPKKYDRATRPYRIYSATRFDNVRTREGRK